MRVAIIGSRSYPYLDEVREFVIALHQKYPDVEVVSGGADGVDMVAETACQPFPVNEGNPIIPVVSFRPFQIDEGHFGVEVWHLGIPIPYIERLTEGAHGMWAEWKGAAWWRNKLIASYADRGVVFWDGHSRGTSNTRDAFEAEGKPCHTYTPQQRFLA